MFGLVSIYSLSYLVLHSTIGNNKTLSTILNNDGTSWFLLGGQGGGKVYISVTQTTVKTVTKEVSLLDSPLGHSNAIQVSKVN